MIILGQLLHHRSRLCAGVTREHVLPPDPVIQTISCPHHVSPISAKHNSSDTRTENILTLNMSHFNSPMSLNICRQNSSCALALKATSITTTYYQIQILSFIVQKLWCKNMVDQKNLRHCSTGWVCNLSLIHTICSLLWKTFLFAPLNINLINLGNHCENHSKNVVFYGGQINGI